MSKRSAAQPAATPSEIALHLGAHRTASTRLQGILNAKTQRGELPSITYAGPQTLRPGLALLLQAGAAPGGLAAMTPSLLRLAAPSLARALRRPDRLILSDENVLGDADRMLLGGGGLYPDARRRLAVLQRLLGERPTRIVLCVRRYDDWFASLYSMAARRRSLPPAGTLAPTWARLPRTWADVVRDVIEVCGSCIVVPYERLDDDELMTVKALLGERGPDVRVVRGLRVNQSIPADVLDEVSAARARGERIDRRALKLRQGTAGGSARVAPFEPAAAEALAARYAADLDAIEALGATLAQAPIAVPESAGA